MSADIMLLQDSIINERCVLVLGPDLYIKEINNEVISRKQYFSKIENQFSSCIYFPNEDVFDAPNDSNNIRVKVQEFYNGKGDLNLLELICSIKFPLILNASPDSSLETFCDDNGIDFKFVTFLDETDENKEVNFNIDNPLVYNLFGNAKDAQEIILDYKKLFEHIQKIIPESSFPSNIRNFLKRASYFIFLGFKFDSWTFQLLSHKILSHRLRGSAKGLSPSELDKIKLEKIKNDRANNQIKSTNINNDSLVNIIMSSSVGMEFTDNTPAQLITEVINTLIEKGKSKYIRDVTNQEKYTYYLSYAHKPENDSEPNIGNITEVFLGTFKEMSEDKSHFKLVYDDEDLHYGQSIDSFMTRIGKGKTVILIISDKYLKSPYCMTEAKRIFNYNNNEERIFAIIIKDSLSTKEEYEIYWQEQAINFVKTDKRRQVDITNAIEHSNEIPDFFRKMNIVKHLEINLSDLQQDKNGKFTLKVDVQKRLNAFTIDLINKLKE